MIPATRVPPCTLPNPPPLRRGGDVILPPLRSGGGSGWGLVRPPLSNHDESDRPSYATSQRGFPKSTRRYSLLNCNDPEWLATVFTVRSSFALSKTPHSNAIKNDVLGGVAEASLQRTGNAFPNPTQRGGNTERNGTAPLE
ncbi:hypothetical protein FW320_08930 [Azospirillum sp. Vi22]|nr:hypothetical protein [Azospirillum baldaniorum]